jgi:hypothetical protein
MEYESEVTWFDGGSVLLEFLPDLEDSTLLTFLKSELAWLKDPTEWTFKMSYAEMALQQTTLVYCEFQGTETASSIVDTQFLHKNAETGCETYPLALFVAQYDGRWAILGALRASTFHQLMTTKYCVTFRDLQVREITKMFDNLELFNQVDYFVLHGCTVDAHDPECDMETRLQETYHLFNCNERMRKWDQYQPLVFQWMIFLASGSDRVLNKLLIYECTALRDRLILLYDNPLLMFELAQKWLRVDWLPIHLNTHRHSNLITRPPELKRLFAHFREHFKNDLLMPTHSLSLPVADIQWQVSYVRCIQCKKFSCTRCEIQKGYVTIPLQDIFFVALQRTFTHLRQLAINCRDKHHTHEGFDLWPRLGFNVSDEALLAEVNTTLQEIGIPKRTHSEMAIRHSLAADIRRVDKIKLFTERDCLILKRVVFPLWRDIAAIRPEDLKPLKEHLLWKLTSKHVPVISRDRPPPVAYSFEHIASREQFLRELGAAPCIASLLEVNKGPTHLANDKRMILSNFVCSRAKNLEVAKQLYIWAWEETDRYTVKCHSNPESFWQDDIGISFLHIWDNYSRFDYNCKKLIERKICVYGQSNGTADIEDLFKSSTLKCTRSLNTKLVAVRRVPRPATFQLYYPIKHSEALFN